VPAGGDSCVLPDANTLSYFGEGEGGSDSADFRSLKDFGSLTGKTLEIRQEPRVRHEVSDGIVLQITVFGCQFRGAEAPAHGMEADFGRLNPPPAGWRKAVGFNRLS